ncbi:MAG: TetR/AcrR family transcriptional regulator [Janthinobacterium lividum]
MPVKPTKHRLLDIAESLYAQGGMASITTRNVAAGMGTNVAPINYHFRTKDGLVEAMLSRAVQPMHEERARLVATFASTHDISRTPTAIATAILIPTVRSILQTTGQHTERQLTLARAASDDHPVVRRFLFGLAATLVIGVNDAFAVCAPALPRSVVDFRRLTFFNARGGIYCNANTFEMISQLLRHHARPEDALVQICILVELLFETGRGESDVVELVRRACALAEPFPAVQTAQAPAGG